MYIKYKSLNKQFILQIYSPTGVVNRDFDDVRRFSDAASTGVKKALSVGARSPLIASFGSKQYRHANLVILLAALEITYVVKGEELNFLLTIKKISFQPFQIR